MYILSITFISILIFLLSIFLIGGVFNFYIIKDRISFSPSQIFYNLLFGLIIIITIYSIIITKGLTVNWILVFTMFCYYLYRKKFADNEKNIEFNEKLDLKNLIACFIVLVFFFIVYSLTIYDFKTNMFYGSFCDNEYYAELSQYLNLGFENRKSFSNFIDPSFTLTPYHYFDVWIGSFFSKIFGLPSLISYNVASSCSFVAILFFGIISLINKKRHFIDNFFIFFISAYFLLFFLTKTNILNIENVIDYYVSQPKLFAHIKLFIPAIFLVWFINSISRKMYYCAMLSMWALCAASTVSIAVTIGMSCFMSIYVIYYYFKNKIVAKKMIFFWVITFIIFICLLLLYLYMNNSGEGSFELKYVGYKKHIKALFSPIINLVSVVPFVLFAFLFRKNIHINNFKKITFFSVVLYVGAIAIAPIAASQYDGIQLYSTIGIPLLYIFVILLFSNIDIESILWKKVYYFVLIISFVLCANHIFMMVEDCLQNRKQCVDYKTMVKMVNDCSNRSILYAYICSDEFYKEDIARSNLELYKPTGLFLSLTDRVYGINISDYTAERVYRIQIDGNVDIRPKTEVVKEGSFYKYVEKMKRENNFISIGQSQIDFLKQYRFQYIFIDRLAKVPKLLEKYLQKISDNADFCFYKLNI